MSLGNDGLYRGRLVAAAVAARCSGACVLLEGGFASGDAPLGVKLLRGPEIWELFLR